MERAELAEALRRAIGGDHPIADSIAGPGEVVLADPNWGEVERAQAADVIKGAAREAAAEGWLLIPTGGTAGKIKFARHDQGTIGAAVAGFAKHFGAARAGAVGLLPLYHVSGLMSWLRCALTGGRYLPWEWKRVERGEFPAPPEGSWRSVSLVPTQLHRLLGSSAAVEWLRKFDAVFIGGGPPWPALLEAAAQARVPVSVGYGMTETAAMACGQMPEEFLAGDRSCGRPLPHIGFSITSDGVATIAGDSVFRGYWTTGAGGRGRNETSFDESSGAGGAKRRFVTEDFAWVDEAGKVHILGRRDAVIITGGKKVDPAEVEAALRAANLLSDLAVIGVPDAEWGQAIALVYPANDPRPTEAAVAAALAGLSGYKRPRRMVPIDPWPRTAQGKLNREALVRKVGCLC